MKVEHRQDRAFFAGDGVETLKLKAAISKRIGPDLVRAEGRNRFSVSADSLPRILDLIEGFEEFAEDARDIRNAANAHECARIKALAILKVEDEGSPIPPWDSILDHDQAVAVHIMTLDGLLGDLSV